MVYNKNMEIVKVETIGNITYILYSNARSSLMKKIIDDGGVVEIYYADDFNTSWQNRASLCV